MSSTPSLAARLLARGLAMFASALVTAGAMQPALAQSTRSSGSGAGATEAEIFRSLPADQQRAIIEQMRRSSGRSSSSTDRQRSTTEMPRTQLPTDTAADRTAQFEFERTPRLRAGDTVVIDVWVRDLGDEDKYEDVRPLREGERDAATRAAVQPSAAAANARSSGARTTPQSNDRRDAKERRVYEDEPILERTREQRERLERFRTRILDGNPYKLDKSGTLNIAGIAPIALAGLTEEQATKRLATDPTMRDYRVLVSLLPLKRQGVDALEPFGYELFATLPSTFAPVTDVPVPSDYVVGPGDTLEVQLVGNTRGDHSLEVARNGRVTLPDIGPIPVSGMRFEAVRALIEERVASQLIGTRAVVSMGELRSIQVVIAGDAEQPGAYTVSPLSTITSALFSSGGVKKIGSLRDIQLRRGGAVVAHLDLYDLLLRGDARSDLRVLSGDVIFIPPVGATVGVTGEVRRPAIYEVKGSATTADVVALAGGLTPEADPRTATLERVDGRRQRVLVDVNLGEPEGRSQRVQAGDLLRLQPVPPTLANSVTVEGHVYRPGSFAWREGLRIADVLPGMNELRENADSQYVLIRRESRTDRRITAESADLEAAWRDRTSAANVPLQPRDRIIVFDLEGGRERAVKPILDDMRRQAVRGQPTKIVSVGGNVRAPGEYPLEVDMTVADLVRAGGSAGEAAYGGEAELTRYEIVNGQSRQAETITIDLSKALAGDPGANVPLRPFDYLVVKELGRFGEQQTIVMGGEVRFPGKYPIKRGERLSSVIQRAGGLTDLAFAQGSLFTRQSLKEREREQLEKIAERLQRDIGQAALAVTQAPNATSQQSSQALDVGQSLLELVRETRPVGRLVIDLPKAMRQPGSEYDVILKDGDQLLVPIQTQEVTVLGEVQGGTSHLYSAKYTRDDYVGLSGGPTQKADVKRTYVVRADGSVVGATGNAWFSRNGARIQPGDTIVVPLNAERIPPLPFWQSVSTIIYNLAVATAAVNSF